MGIIGLLNKKAPDDGVRDDSAVLSFRAQAYQSTSAALPPVRGSFPVSGNGPDALDGLQRAAKKRSEAHIAGVALDWPAPAPLVPRLRGGNLDRPNTAPSLQPSLSPSPSLQRPVSSRRRRDSIRGSISFLRRAGSNASLNRRTETSHSNVLMPPVPPIPAYHLGSETSLTSSRSQGFVDLLDAQSELRPSDFRSRIKAAGARDYGEDVAERNMGQNATDLSNPAVQAFYASVEEPDDSAPPPTIPRRDRRGNGTRPHGHASRNITEPTPSIRPKTSGSSTPISFPKRTTSFEPWRAGQAVDDTGFRPAEPKALANTTRSSRRMSMHEYTEHPENGRPRPRPLSMHPVVSNFSLPPTVATGTPSDRLLMEGDPSYPPVVPPLSPLRPRDSLVVAKKKKRSTDDSPHVPSLPRDYALAAKYLSQTSDESSYDDHTQVTKRPVVSSSKGKARQTSTHRNGSRGSNQSSLEESTAGGAASVAPISRAPTRSVHGGHHPRTGHRKSASDLGENDSYHYSGASPAGPSSRAPEYGSEPAYPRTRSLGGTSLPPRPQLDDITEHIPVRTSSVRHWSLSSSTPPTTSSSNQSSNVFPRSQSRHTADTSVDLSYGLPLPKPGDSNGVTGTPSSVAQSAYFTAVEDDMSTDTVPTPRNGTPSSDSGYGQMPIPHGRASFGLHSVGYSTTEDSDADSFMEKRIQLQKARDDEGLLFRSDAYGERGTGLPGLFDEPLSPTLSDWSTTQTGTDLTFMGDDLTPRGGLRPPNMTHNPRWPFIGSDLAIAPNGAWVGADFGEDFGSETGSAAVTPVVKLDPRSAAQLRKEMKKRNRMATMARGHGKRALQRNSEDGHVLDSGS